MVYIVSLLSFSLIQAVVLSSKSDRLHTFYNISIGKVYYVSFLDFPVTFNITLIDLIIIYNFRYDMMI